MRYILLLLVLAALAAAIYVRNAPYEAERWHRPSAPKAPGDYPMAGGFEAVRAITTTPEAILRAVDTVAMRTDRTRRVSGGPETGLMTYKTRSALWGFPDYTTVGIVHPEGADTTYLSIKARLRFGQSDMGVNRARVEEWLDALGPLVVRPS